jgi:hypothetical protein
MRTSQVLVIYPCHAPRASVAPLNAVRSIPTTYQLHLLSIQCLEIKRCRCSVAPTRSCQRPGISSRNQTMAAAHDQPVHATLRRQPCTHGKPLTDHIYCTILAIGVQRFSLWAASELLGTSSWLATVAAGHLTCAQRCSCSRERIDRKLHTHGSFIKSTLRCMSAGAARCGASSNRRRAASPGFRGLVPGQFIGARRLQHARH